ncbi:MAG: hypothetical protein ACRDYE_05450 [Acidimicrobiales bacterium]
MAALGEPALGSITADNAETVLFDCRWRSVYLNDRSKAAGFVVAAPAAPGCNRPSSSAGRVTPS